LHTREKPGYENENKDGIIKVKTTLENKKLCEKVKGNNDVYWYGGMKRVFQVINDLDKSDCLLKHYPRQHHADGLLQTDDISSKPKEM
jgi:hypothetical protein